MKFKLLNVGSKAPVKGTLNLAAPSLLARGRVSACTKPVNSSLAHTRHLSSQISVLLAPLNSDRAGTTFSKNPS